MCLSTARLRRRADLQHVDALLRRRAPATPPASTAYGPQHLCIGNVCVAGQCRVSSDCPGGADLRRADAHLQRRAPATPRAASIRRTARPPSASRAAASPGDCHGLSGDCPTGQLCGISTPNTCGGCSTRRAVHGRPRATARATSASRASASRATATAPAATARARSAGYVCGAQNANTCGACATDSQCQADPTYGSATICNTTTGQTDERRVRQRGVQRAAAPCAANAGDFCCSGSVHARQLLRRRRLRAAWASVYRCVNNSCTGLLGRDRQQVLRRSDERQRRDRDRQRHGRQRREPELQLQDRDARAAGRRRLRGAGHADHHRRPDAARRCRWTATETLPIIVPANVTITTQNGPDPRQPAGQQRSQHGQRRRLPAGRRSGGASRPTRRRRSPSTAASNSSGIGIGVSPGAGKSASLSYVTVQNTGGHGIAVSNGTLPIGQGVTVTGAGTALKRRDGLNVAGGLGQHHGDQRAGADARSTTTRQHGIYVTGAGVLNITGFPVTVPAPNGQGTVVASGNAFAGLRIFEAPGAAGAEHDQRLRRLAERAERACGSTAARKVKVRNSVFLANVLNGVYVTALRRDGGGQRPVAASISGPCRTPGHNVLQAAVGSMPDLAGLCVAMSPRAGTLTLSARGNVFAGPTDCATSTAAHRALGGVRRLRRPGRRLGGGHDRDRRRRGLPVATRARGRWRLAAARGDAYGSAPAMIQARMRAIAAFGSHLRGGIVGRSRCSIFASSRLPFGSRAITTGPLSPPRMRLS